MAHTTLAGLHCNGEEFKKVCNTALAVEIGSDLEDDNADDCIRFCVRSDVVQSAFHGSSIDCCLLLEEEGDIILLVDLFLYLFCLDFCFCFFDFCLEDDDAFTLLLVDAVDWPFICVVDVDLSATVADMNSASDMSGPFCWCCLMCGYDSQLMPLLLIMDGCDGASSASANFILPH